MDDYLQEDYFVRYFVEAIGEAESLEPLSMPVVKRKSPEAITPHVGYLDISDLPTGNFNLIFEVRNRYKELVAQKSVLFQRDNPYLNLGK